MKIVIGLDDSPSSQAALDFLKKIAPHLRAGTVVTIVATAHAGLGVPAMAGPEEDDHGVILASQVALARAEHDLGIAGVVTAGRVLRGDAGEALVRTANEVGADMIVVGSHAESDMANLVLGTVAAHVVTHARCKVLVLKADGSIAGTVRP